MNLFYFHRLQTKGEREVCLIGRKGIYFTRCYQYFTDFLQVKVNSQPMSINELKFKTSSVICVIADSSLRFNLKMLLQYFFHLIKKGHSIILYETIGSLIKKSHILNRNAGKEQKISYGHDYADKIFYKIGVPHEINGLGAMLLSQINHILYAVGKEFSPIVDLENFPIQYLDAKKKGNAWEYYFEQPMNFSLTDIQKAKQVVLSEQAFYPVTRAIDDQTFYDLKGNYADWQRLFKDYIRFNAETKIFLNEKQSKIFCSNDRILGVLCRGTDYLHRKPSGHPRQPEPSMVIEKASQVASEWGYQKIYLATEDEDIYRMFKEHFGDALLANDQQRVTTEDIAGVQYLSESQSYRQNNYLRGLDYLTSLYLLSKCQGFIGGRCAGTLITYLMSNGFEYDYTWDLGKY